jgi:hypothetical protein
MRIRLWTVITVALLGIGASAAIGQEVVQMPGYYSPDGTPCGADGAPCGAGGAGAGGAGRGGLHHKHVAGVGPHHVPHKGNRNAIYRSQYKPWHGGYYDVSYGTPVAQVVPPNAEYQTNYGWGVGNTRVSRIDSQFQLPYPGAGAAAGSGYGFMPTPQWPSNTMQFGDYYVRGPW